MDILIPIEGQLWKWKRILILLKQGQVCPLRNAAITSKPIHGIYKKKLFKKLLLFLIKNDAKYLGAALLTT